MLKTLDVPTTNISTLKKDPTKIFNNAEDQKTGVYVFNRDTPAGIVMSVKDYERMVHELNELQERLLDLEIEKEAELRIKNDDGRRYSDEEVRGSKVANKMPVIDENDGWE